MKFLQSFLRHQSDLATGWDLHLTTGKHAERTKYDFWCSVCRSAFGQASSLICACRHQLTFPFCYLISPSFCGETCGDIAKCWLFSPTMSDHALYCTSYQNKNYYWEKIYCSLQQDLCYIGFIILSCHHIILHY